MKGNGKNYYVYALADPRTGEWFYVGKGKDGRAWKHEADVRAGRCLNALKTQRILNIIEANHEVQCEFVAENLLESEALALERRLIDLHRDRLTNLAPGSVLAIEREATRASALLARMRPRNEVASGEAYDLIRSQLEEIARGGMAAVQRVKVRQVVCGGIVVDQSITYA